MNSKNAIIEEYLDMVRKKIHKAEDADRFIDFLREDLEGYCDSNPGCTEEDLIREFGSPEEVAKNYINDNLKVDPTKLSKTKVKRTILIVLLAIVLVFAIVKTVMTVITYFDVIGGYGIIETEIEEETVDD